MKGPIFDYDKQRWTNIDTERDHGITEGHYVTPCGVEYQVTGEHTYRNYVGPEEEAALIAAGY